MSTEKKIVRDEFTEGLLQQERAAYDEIQARNADNAQFMPWLRLVKLPSFRNPERRDVYGGLFPDHITRKYVAAYRWRQDIDRRRVRQEDEHQVPIDWTPTIEHKEIDLSFEVVSQIRTMLDSLSVPVTVQEPFMGEDGTSYEMSIHNLTVACTFSWWEEGPEGWRELSNTFQTIWSLLGQAAGDE